MKRWLMATGLVMMMAGMAGAQAPGDEPREETFEDELVPGDYASPLGEILPVRDRGRRVSLIRTRNGFMPELYKSVETI